MKARFFAIAALVLGLASCQKDFAPEANLGAEVDYRLEVSATELGVTRAGDTAEKPQEAKDSAFGAIDYFQGADWSKVDLRYTLEIYDANEDGSLKSATPVKDRQAIVVDEYKAVTFETRLAPKRHYRFVVFADFVENGAATAWSEAEKLTKDGLNHRIGATLANIELINEDINDEASDAYFAFKEVVPGNNTHNTDAITLTRPYGKLRVVATDLHELNLNVKPGSVKVVYDAYNAKTFNAVEGTISGEYAEKEFDYDYVNEGIVYTAGKDALKNEKDRNTHMTIFTDYILAEDTQHTINFNMLVNDTDGVEIKATAFSTEIPVQRNHLTTIIGNVLTTATEVEVTINDNFANADNQNWVFEAFVNGGVVTLDEDYEIGSTLYVEADAVLNLNGKTIKNAAGNKNTDVIVVKGNGKLTINGEGAIEAVTGNDGYAIIVRDNAELVINGGTYKSGVDENNEPNAVIYARDNGKVFVNGGTFPNDNNSKYVLNKRDADRTNTTIEVRGGKFQNFNPANNAAEGAGTNFLAPGYGVIEYAPNYYEVVKMTSVKNEEELKAALAAKAERIRFLNDITLTTQFLNIEGVKTEIFADGYKLTTSAKSKNYSLYVFGESDVIINDLVIEDRGGFQVYGQSNLVVNNADVLANFSTGGRNIYYVAQGSTVTVNGGKYATNRTTVRYFYSTADSKIFVTAGEFGDNVVNGGALAFSDNPGVIEIKGGTFTSTTRDLNPTQWVAAGYEAVKNGNTWTVQAE